MSTWNVARGVAWRTLHNVFTNPREAAGEGDEEEERKDERGQEQGRVREDVVERPPGDGASDGECPHVLAILSRNAQLDSTSATTVIAAAIPKASTSACPSQPMIMRLRNPSIR